MPVTSLGYSGKITLNCERASFLGYMDSRPQCNSVIIQMDELKKKETRDNIAISLSHDIGGNYQTLLGTFSSEISGKETFFLEKETGWKFAKVQGVRISRSSLVPFFFPPIHQSWGKKYFAGASILGSN